LFCSDHGSVKNIKEHAIHTVPKTVPTETMKEKQELNTTR